MDVKQKTKWAACSIVFGSFIGGLATVGYRISGSVLDTYFLKYESVFLFIKAMLFSSIVLSLLFLLMNVLLKKMYRKEQLAEHMSIPKKYWKIVFEAGALIGSSPILMYYYKNNGDYAGVLFNSSLLIFVFSEYIIDIIVKYNAFKSASTEDSLPN